MLLSVCVELPLSVLLVIRFIKCFVTPTLTYTAQVDEGVLHICFDFRYIIEYMRWSYFVSTAGDSRFKTLSHPDLTYTAQVDEIVLHVCFESHWIIEYMR